MTRQTHPAQLGFDALISEAEHRNHAHRFARETAHLPQAMQDALPFFRALLNTHHAAMMAGDAERVQECRDEARRLAVLLNGGCPGICADATSPGRVLTRDTAADPDTVPLWGQQGSFMVRVQGCPIRIEMDGLFGIGAASSYWLGFGAYAVDSTRPFISQTGYRSFLGVHAAPAAGFTPDAFVQEVIAAYLAKECKGRLVTIAEPYRSRLAA